MKRTRRATLAVIATSSTAVAIDALGLPSGATGRGDRTTVDDANATLGLDEAGLETVGDLFDGEVRTAPVTVDLVNRLPEPVAVTLESDRFRLAATDGNATVDDGRLRAGTDGRDSLGPGERIAGITVDLPPSGDAPTGGSAVTGTVEITATGEETAIEATRELTLEPRGHTVERARLAAPQAAETAHRWLLEGVDTAGSGLETIRVDYRRLETDEPVDLTAGEAPSATVVADGAEYPATVVRRRSDRLAVSLDRPLPLEDADLELVLDGTGVPPRPDDGNVEGDRPSGATIELLGGGYSARVEGVWSDR